MTQTNRFVVAETFGVKAPRGLTVEGFTDPLHPDQNLEGLVGIGDRDDLRFVTRGNLVEIYGTKGFSGELTVRVSAGIRNALGFRMREPRELGVAFEQLKPQVRFAGRGVIVPTSANLTVPVEAVNLKAVVVEAIRVPEGNVPWFLQVNDLDGDRELNRVGRVVWKKTLSLEATPDRKDRWVPVGLDLSPLVAQGPGGLYRLALSFRRPLVVWPCEGDADAGAHHRGRAGFGRAGGELLGRLVAVRGRGLAGALRGAPRPLPGRVLRALLRPRHPRCAQRSGVRHRPRGEGGRGRVGPPGRHRPEDRRPPPRGRGVAARLPAGDPRLRPHRR